MFKTYTVKKGDTLSHIANTFGTTTQTLKAVNASIIKDANKIQVGWKINIPVTADKISNDEIGKQFRKALKDIRNLDSVKTLLEMVGD